MDYDEITSLIGIAVDDELYIRTEADRQELSEFLDFLDNFPGLADAWNAR